jgi:cyclopropane-fatty-acyl-phospholipid synthase
MPTTSNANSIIADARDATTTNPLPALPTVPEADKPASALFSYLSQLSRSLVLRFIANSVKLGALTLIDVDGTEYNYGQPLPPDLSARYNIYKLDRPITLRVVNDYFYFRCLTGGGIGFAESFILNEIDLDSGSELSRLLVLLAVNRAHAEFDERDLGFAAWVAELAATGMHRIFRRNTLTGARRNIQAHYDLSNDMFATFLGKTWVYSCAIFEKDSDTLDQAQVRVKNKELLLPTVHGVPSLPCRSCLSHGRQTSSIA